MRQSACNIDDAIEELKHKYEEAKKLEFVYNPVAYALYHTWKKYDDLISKVVMGSRGENITPPKADKGNRYGGR